ncbi:glcg protein [Tolypothrix tenuis PCC 7101]|uniref:Glcg protein n=1 Tax=Tolypothrix tenuis PCC 7101 TaxID=231146 RepID=A0A1Z4N288_9CYAN|nr:heme-binding protein [Aulosira sp. FACHB-113]BAY99741.1 glcg protein [Tolypothrix tenuis PCC 7101]BAZ76337.1 glcg protein [Aulosira laxa NIES-50]
MVQTSTSKRTVELITVDTALAAVKAGLKESQNLGANVSIAVYNSLLTLVAFAHGDDAPPHSVQTSKRKAQTAASIRRPTGTFADHLAVALPLASGNLLTNLGGGLPIRFGGDHVGAIGVGGGTVEQDIAIAKAALSAIGAEPID